MDDESTYVSHGTPPPTIHNPEKYKHIEWKHKIPLNAVAPPASSMQCYDHLDAYNPSDPPASTLNDLMNEVYNNALNK